jgi:hypothetical protein
MGGVQGVSQDRKVDVATDERGSTGGLLCHGQMLADLPPMRDTDGTIRSIRVNVSPGDAP